MGEWLFSDVLTPGLPLLIGVTTTLGSEEKILKKVFVTTDTELL